MPDSKMASTHTPHMTQKPASMSSRYSSRSPGKTTNSARVPSTAATAITPRSSPCRLGKIRSRFFSNSRSDTNRVKASCTNPVRIRLQATRYVTDVWNWVTRKLGTTTLALKIPTSKMPMMENTQGPEPMTPAYA